VVWAIHAEAKVIPPLPLAGEGGERGKRGEEKLYWLRLHIALGTLALLTAIAVLLVSGPLAVWSGGRAINVFDWFAIPSPMGEMPALHKALEVAHGLAAKVMLFSLAAHVLAALKHALFDRDGTLWRIFGRAPAAQ
jgi:cytochrome b561